MAYLQSTSITGSFHPGRSQGTLPGTGSLYWNPYTNCIPYSAARIGALQYTYNGCTWKYISKYPYADGSSPLTRGSGAGSFGFGFDQGKTYQHTVKIDTGNYNGVWSMCQRSPTSNYGRTSTTKSGCTDSLVWGGRCYPTNAIVATTYEFDQVFNTWGGEGNKSTLAVYPGGAGTPTAALSIGGVGPSGACISSEEYNGSAWSTGGNMNVALEPPFASWGYQTTAVRAGGLISSPFTTVACTEEYNGSTWSTGPSLNAARRCAAGGGATATNGIVWAGRSATPGAVISMCTEVYDGVSYSNAPANNDVSTSLNGAGTSRTQQVSWGDFSSSNTELWSYGVVRCNLSGPEEYLEGIQPTP